MYEDSLDECGHERYCQIISLHYPIMEGLKSSRFTKVVEHVQQPALNLRIYRNDFYCTYSLYTYINFDVLSLHWKSKQFLYIGSLRNGDKAVMNGVHG